jgi:hypothetical protein
VAAVAAVELLGNPLVSAVKVGLVVMVKCG